MSIDDVVRCQELEAQLAPLRVQREQALVPVNEERQHHAYYQRWYETYSSICQQMEQTMEDLTEPERYRNNVYMRDLNLRDRRNSIRLIYTLEAPVRALDAQIEPLEGELNTLKQRIAAAASCKPASRKRRQPDDGHDDSEDGPPANKRARLSENVWWLF